MKKIILFIALLVVMLLPAIQSYGQGYKWGAWQSDPCFSGLQFRSRRDASVATLETDGKYYWYTQYRNAYQKRVAFDYSVKGSQQEVGDHIKTYGGQYRTEIKPGEIDSALWGSYSSPEKIWEVVGHLRFLDGDDVDVGQPYNNCDGSGNRGQIDYICRNEPKPQFSCSNFVHPPPAAFVFWSKMTGAGVTSAAKQPTPQDCLDLYKYFSDNRKSDDPVAIKQSLDAAQVFQTLCKMTEEQKAGVGQAITSSQNRLEKIKANASDNSSRESGIVQSDAEKMQFDGEGRVTSKNVEITVTDDNNVQDDYYQLYINGEKYIGDVFNQPGGSTTNTATLRCGKNLIELRFYKDMGKSTKLMLIINKGEFSKSFEGSTDHFYAISTPPCVKSDLDDDESNKDEPKREPTTIEQYQKKVVAEAKAKGITLSPNFLTENPTTPTQKKVPDSQLFKDLDELIQQDSKAVAEEQAELDRIAAEKRRKDEAEAAKRRTEEEERLTKERRLASVRKYGNYGCKGDDEFCQGKLPYSNKSELMSYVSDILKQTLVRPRYFVSYSFGSFTYNNTHSEDEVENNIWLGKMNVTARYRCEITINLSRVTSKSDWNLRGNNLVTSSCTRNGKYYKADPDDDFDLDDYPTDLSYINSSTKDNLNNALSDLANF